MNYTKNNVARRNFNAACDIVTMLNNQLPNTEIQYIVLHQGLSEHTLFPKLIDRWNAKRICDEIGYFGGEGEMTATVVRHDYNVTPEDKEQGNFIYEWGYGNYKMDIETLKYN